MKNIFTFLLLFAISANTISSEKQILTPDNLINAITATSLELDKNEALSEKQKLIDAFLENDIELSPLHVLKILDFILNTNLKSDQIEIILQFLFRAKYMPCKYDNTIQQDITSLIKELVRKYATIDISITKKVLSLTDQLTTNPFETKSLILNNLIVEEKSQDILLFSLKSNNLYLILNNYSDDLPVYNSTSFEFLKELLLQSNNKDLIIELAKFSVSSCSLAYSLNTKDIEIIYSRLEETNDEDIKSALSSLLTFLLHSNNLMVLKKKDEFNLLAFLSSLLNDPNVPVEKKYDIISHIAYCSIFNNEGIGKLEKFLLTTENMSLFQSCIYNLIHVTGTSQDYSSVLHIIHLLLIKLPNISNKNLNLFCVAFSIQKKLLSKDEQTYFTIRKTIFSEIRKRILDKNSFGERQLLYSCLDNSIFDHYRKKERLTLLLYSLKNEKDESNSQIIIDTIKKMLNVNEKSEIKMENLEQIIASMPDDSPEDSTRDNQN